MSKFEEVMKSEIMRLARKATKEAVKSLTKRQRELKNSVSALRDAVADLDKQLAVIVRQGVQGVGTGLPTDAVRSARLTPKLIKKLRKRLGLTQDKLAIVVGVSKGAIVSWESGRSSPRYASRAALVALRGKGRRDVTDILAGKGYVKRRRRGAKRKTAKKSKRAK